MIPVALGLVTKDGRELTSGLQLDRARAEKEVTDLSRATGLLVRPERKVPAVVLEYDRSAAHVKQIKA